MTRAEERIGGRSTVDDWAYPEAVILISKIREYSARRISEEDIIAFVAAKLRAVESHGAIRGCNQLAERLDARLK